MWIKIGPGLNAVIGLTGLQTRFDWSVKIWSWPSSDLESEGQSQVVVTVLSPKQNRTTFKLVFPTQYFRDGEGSIQYLWSLYMSVYLYEPWSNK